jgi:hypothetical protein
VIKNEEKKRMNEKRKKKKERKEKKNRRIKKDVLVQMRMSHRIIIIIEK